MLKIHLAAAENLSHKTHSCTPNSKLVMRNFKSRRTLLFPLQFFTSIPLPAASAFKFFAVSLRWENICSLFEEDRVKDAARRAFQTPNDIIIQEYHYLQKHEVVETSNHSKYGQLAMSFFGYKALHGKKGTGKGTKATVPRRRFSWDRLCVKYGDSK